jgi:putative ABC transport system permease protein
MLLLVVFAGLTLILAAVGIYGVMSYAVTQRTQEIGIRIALGARPSDVLKLVVKGGIGLAVTGVGIGVLIALGLTHLMEAVLFGVALVAVATLACYFPARRATKVNPITAMREE